MDFKEYRGYFKKFLDGKKGKIDIQVIKVIAVMKDTTISVSREFHNWLTSQGKKGEKYEDVIRRMLRPEFAKSVPGSVAKKI